MSEKIMNGNQKLRITILDLKWSYGIERMSTRVFRELEKYGSVSMLAATESRFPEAVKIAPSRTYLQMTRAFVNPMTYIRIFRHFRKTRPDIVYINSPHMAHAATVLLCRAFTGIYVISHVHDPECGGKRWIAVIANTVARIQSRFSHRVYCCGNAIKETICAKFRVPPSRVAVFRLGPEQATASEKSDPVGIGGPFQYFSFIGTFHERKGVDVFLRAALHFNAVHGSEKTQFLLAGSGDIDRYAHLVRALPNLTLCNRFFSDDEVNESLQKSYALVLPYIGGMMQSSFISIAYGNGCPVIVSRNGSMFEEVEHGSTGYIVERGDPFVLAEAMARLSSGETRREFSSNCLSFYRTRFSWEVIAKQMHDDMRQQLNGAFALRAGAAA